ncbi:single-stranded DNA-binding protein [Streptosporangium canum]|uniref:single-stranded DNA-binding protein n=1 Tax=Streptosporangium canum TaxID=324952 RepID=UPI0036998809
MYLDIQLSFTGRIKYAPRFFPVDHEAPAMWSAVLEVNGPPTPGRNGEPYIPTRYIEVVTYGLAATRAHESYQQNDLVIVQATDLTPRTYEGKGPDGKKVTRAVIKVIATAIGLCSRYTAVAKASGSRQPTPSPRLAQGASAIVAERPAAVA